MNFRDFAELDGVALAESIRRGDTGAAEALELSYRLVEKLDPQVNAFVSLEKDLAGKAAATAQGLLAGVPMAMKDCVGFVQGAPRWFGSRLSDGSCIDFEDEVVSRYRAAGLVPMGTTNVPELSSSITTESILHGPCRNPWNLQHSSGGSSGGSAAAVAYGAVPIAYGNDAAGSIRVPASCCGVFGLRPSRGRVPTGPVFGEFWYGLMVHHVITRSVRDSALVLDISQGMDAGAPYAAPDPQRVFLQECSIPPGQLRIAVSDGSESGYPVHADCRMALADTVALLEELGHQVEWVSPDYSGEQLHHSVITLLSVSLAREIPDLAAQSGKPIGPETVEACHLELMERGRRVSALQLTEILEFKSVLGRLMGRFFGRHDVYLTPALAEPPLALGVLDSNSGDLDAYLQRFWQYCPFTPLANVCGLPSMSVPLCWSKQGLPLGMMFTAAYANEAVLFRLAAQLEQARPWKNRHPPVSAWNLNS